MNITDARKWVGDAIRDQSGIESDRIDRAIMFAGNVFNRITKQAHCTESVSITSASNIFPLSSAIAQGFRPECVEDVWIDGQPRPLTIISDEEANRYAALNATLGIPAGIAFTRTTSVFIAGPSDGILYPTPSANYTAKLRFWQPFGVYIDAEFIPGWDPGTLDDPTLSGTLNIPDDLIMPVLMYGAAALIRTPNPEVAFGTETWKRFTDYCTECVGVNALGVKSFQRASSSSLRHCSSRRFPGVL